MSTAVAHAVIFSLWPSSVTRTKVGPARRVRPSMRATDVSPRSSPLRDVSRGGTSATQRQKIHTDDVNQCLHSHGVPNAKLFLLAKRSSAAMSEEKRLPFAGYWGATLPPQKSDPARRINLLAEPTFFCKQLATLAYGSDNCIFYTRTNRSARLTWSLQPRLQGFSFFPRPSIWTRLTPMARQARAHNLEHATPILGLCKGVFTYQFIFSTIWQHFSPRNWKHRPVRVRIHTDRTTITLKKKK